MANDESAIREVDQAVAEERQMELYRRRGPVLIALALAIVLGVAGWEFWKTRETGRARDAALAFDAAARAATNREDAEGALSAFAADAPAGYAALAHMRLANVRAGSGDMEGARTLYRRVYETGDAPRRVRDLARLRAAMISLADGRDAMLGDLGGLADGDGALGHHARELVALAALVEKDYQTARAMFERAEGDPVAPESIRERAREFAALAAAGQAGVNLTGEARVEDLMRALEEGGPVLDDHDHDHDHAGEALADEPTDRETRPDDAAASAAEADSDTPDEPQTEDE